MANSYSKSLELKIKPILDSKEMSQIDREFKNLSAVKFLDEKNLDAFKKTFTEIRETEKIVDELSKSISELEKYGGSKDEIENLKSTLKKFRGEDEESKGYDEEEGRSFGQDFADEFNKKLKNDLLDGYDSLGAFFGGKVYDIFVDALKAGAEYIEESIKAAYESIAEMAGWDLSSSTTYNSNAASMLMNWGLSGSNAYAAYYAAKEIGFSSFDDMMNNIYLVNDEMLEKFNSYYELYLKEYENSESLSDAFQDFNDSWNQISSEIEESWIAFLNNYEDVIVAVLDAILGIYQFVADILDWLLDPVRDDEERLDALYDILGVEASSSNTVSFTMNNSYNGISSKDQDWISNTNALTYTQITKSYE